MADGEVDLQTAPSYRRLGGGGNAKVAVDALWGRVNPGFVRFGLSAPILVGVAGRQAAGKSAGSGGSTAGGGGEAGATQPGPGGRLEGLDVEGDGRRLHPGAR